MPKSMRKVTLGFSLVSVPCKVYKATEDRDIHLKQIHAADCGLIRMRRYCESCDSEVPYSDTGKGYLLSDRVISLADEDFSALPEFSGNEIIIDQFADSASINPLLMNGQHYYLGPDLGGDKGYILMTEAMERSGRVALAKAALHGRERIAAIRPVNGILVMDMLSWDDEIRNPDEISFKSTPKPAEAEIDLAVQLIEALDAPFDQGKFSDTYTAALAALVESKVNDPDAPTPSRQAVAPEPSMTDQLTAALKAQKSSRSAAGSSRRKKASVQ